MAANTTADATSATTPLVPQALDSSIYHLNGDELAFFKTQTGIQNEDELRDHILEIQAKAYAIYPYPCIQRFAFTAFKLAKYPAYEAVLKLGKNRKDACLLDLGCCFGGDVRKAIFDGFPRENVIAADLHTEFWDLGKQLYKNSPPEIMPACFLSGDVFDPSFLSPDASPAPSSSTAPEPPLSLATLGSLTPVQHRLSVIHAGAFFHLFDAVKQRELAHLLATLLSPLPGSMILGSHMGVPDTDEFMDGGTRHSRLAPIRKMFGHSPTSWTKLWAGSDGIFKPQDVTVWVKTREVERRSTNQSGEIAVATAHVLVWSVTRV